MQSLLELGLAITGKLIDLDRVHITDTKVISQITESSLAATGKSLTDYALDGYRQDDGSLLVVLGINGTEHLRCLVSPGDWRLMSEKEIAEQRDSEQEEPVPDALRISAEHRRNHQDFISVAEHQLANADAVLLVVNKTEAGMNALRSFFKLVRAKEEAADAWLSGDDAFYIVYSRRKSLVENWQATWPNLAGMDEFLIVAASRCLNLAETVLVVETGDVDETATLNRTWAKLGGAILGQIKGGAPNKPATPDPEPYRGDARLGLKQQARAGGRVLKEDIPRIKALADLLPQLDTYALPHTGMWLLDEISAKGDLPVKTFRLPTPLCLIQFTMKQSLPGPGRTSFDKLEIRRRLAVVADLRDERAYLKVRPFLQVDQGLKAPEMKKHLRAGLLVIPIDDTGDPTNPKSAPWEMSTVGLLLMLSGPSFRLSAKALTAGAPPTIEMEPAYLVTALESGYVWRKLAADQGEDVTASMLRDVINETAAAIQLGFADSTSIREVRKRDIHGPAFSVVGKH